MSGKLHSRLLQHLGSEKQGVHHQILGGMKMPDCIPAADLVFPQHILITHPFDLALIRVIVQIIADNQIYRNLSFLPFTDFMQKLLQLSLIQPVILVDNLEIFAGR